jgi:hypothetical protein
MYIKSGVAFSISSYELKVMTKRKIINQFDSKPLKPKKNVQMILKLNM